jgi:hypothetical protein
VSLEVPANYQKMEKELEAVSDISYQDYLESYQELKSYYYRYKLLEKGIVFTPLYDRIIISRNREFLTGMLDHYIQSENYEHALRVLHRLKELELEEERVASRQKTIAEALANSDAKTSPDRKPAEILRERTGEDKWFHTFRRTYKMTWLRASKWKIKYWPFLWKK